MSARTLRIPLLAYGSVRMPLALLELPLYLLLPAFYQQRTGADLALVGAVLMMARLLDAIADPLIGQAIDRLRHRIDARQWVWLGLPVLTVGFVAMLKPPADPTLALAWLAGSSLLTYIAYSTVSIAYQAWGATIGSDPGARARVTGTREAFGLLGVLLASALLTPSQTDVLLLVYVVLAGLSALACLRAPRPATREPAHSLADTHQSPTFAQGWRKIASNRDFRWLLAAFMANGIATAIPATLALFFMQDVLGADGYWPQIFLGSYFLAGAIGMPFWIRLSGVIGLRNSWLIGMAFAALAFVWAFGLRQGDLYQFLAICLITGLALGSDLALPAALLAETIGRRQDDQGREGSYFGVWTLATKLNLAIAAGIALPALSLLGYIPGQAGQDTLALSLSYAAIPCACKLAASLMLLLSPSPLPEPAAQTAQGVTQ